MVYNILIQNDVGKMKSCRDNEPALSNYLKLLLLSLWSFTQSHMSELYCLLDNPQVMNPFVWKIVKNVHGNKINQKQVLTF